jgi:Fe-S cluster assembly protein SufD
VSALAAERDRVVSVFRSFADALEPGGPAWLAPVREAAIDRFATLGFPTAKREDWKYTNATAIARAVSLEPVGAGGAVAADTLAAVGASGGEHSLVFVNGRFAPELSSRGCLPEGAVVDGLANVLRDRPELAEPLLNRPSAAGGRCFVDLNAAFQRDGAFVSLPPGAEIEHPIHLVFLATGAAEGRTLHPRNLIAVGESAAAVVVERYEAVGDAEYLTNAVTDVVVGAGAQLDRVALERESERASHVGTLIARLGRDACFRSHAVSLSAALARSEICAVLEAAHAECVLNGLFVANGRRHVDNQTTIDHAEPGGTSRELYKGVLDGRSKGVFNGKVIVRPDAQKTNAQQSNPNLLLSDGAEIDTRPNLEIHADDVKCSHGSTIGRLDDDALFFLRARAIGEAQARQMLCRAFASEVIDQIPGAPLREEIGRSVAAKLGNAELEAA